MFGIPAWLENIFLAIGLVLVAFIGLDTLTAAYIERRERRLQPARVAAARRRRPHLRPARPPSGPRAQPPYGFPTHANYPEPYSPDRYAVKVYAEEDFDPDLLLALGSERKKARWWALEFWGEYWLLTAPTEQEWDTFLGELRDAGVAFLGAGPDWHLGGEFERLREAGLVSGSYHLLEFTGRGWRVRDG